MGKKYIIVVADTNDADYITNKREITDEQLEALKPVFKVLLDRRAKLNEDRDKNWNEFRHNWEIGEFARKKTPENLYIETELLTEEQVELFNNFVPNGEYGIHTIEQIDIIEVANETKIL